MRKAIIIISILVATLSACESKHQSMQREIASRKAALKQHQDSALNASEKDVQKLDQLLQKANRDYAKMKAEADAAHAAGTATAEQLTNVTRMRLYRDSLQTAFDVQCAKIKYIRKRQKE